MSLGTSSFSFLIGSIGSFSSSSSSSFLLSFNKVNIIIKENKDNWKMCLSDIILTNTIINPSIIKLLWKFEYNIKRTLFNIKALFSNKIIETGKRNNHLPTSNPFLSLVQ